MEMEIRSHYLNSYIEAHQRQWFNCILLENKGLT